MTLHIMRIPTSGVCAGVFVLFAADGAHIAQYLSGLSAHPAPLIALWQRSI